MALSWFAQAQHRHANGSFNSDEIISLVHASWSALGLIPNTQSPVGPEAMFTLGLFMCSGTKCRADLWEYHHRAVALI